MIFNCNCQLSLSICQSQGADRDCWALAKRVITYDKVVRANNSFKPYKSSGPDEILRVLLQQGEDYLAPLLCKLYRGSLALGDIPKVWNRARVTCIPKPGRSSHAEANAYGSITLSSFIL